MVSGKYLVFGYSLPQGMSQRLQVAVYRLGPQRHDLLTSLRPMYTTAWSLWVSGNSYTPPASDSKSADENSVWKLWAYLVLGAVSDAASRL